MVSLERCTGRVPRPRAVGMITPACLASAVDFKVIRDLGSQRVAREKSVKIYLTDFFKSELWGVLQVL